MNESDTDANTKAIDSLLNFETVKYFGTEAEAARFDALDGRYENAAIHIWTSLAGLNFGQARDLHHRHDRSAWWLAATASGRDASDASATSS